MVSEDSNDFSESLDKEKKNKYEPTNELNSKQNVQTNSINWNFTKEHHNKQLNYINVFGNSASDAVLGGTRRRKSTRRQRKSRRR